MTAALGEKIGIRAYSDLHLDERLVRWDDVKRVAAQDAADGVKYAVGIGDIANLVLPPDLRRYRQSVQPKDLQGLDDWLDSTIDFVADRLREMGYTWLLLTPGNHEDEVLKRHGVNVTRHLAERVGCPSGGYSGALDLPFVLTPQNVKSRIRLLWHHGAWGGDLAKGYIGALKFFSQHDDWDFALYGHNHHARHDPEERCKIDHDRVIHYRAHLVNLSSAVESYSADAGITHYGERHGYRRTPFAPAVLWMRFTRSRSQNDGAVSKWTTVES